ncbi:hypothetical protein ACFLU5_00325 [Bacteroidota bacterium]
MRNEEDEIFIRKRMWWCYNDYYRNQYDTKELFILWDHLDRSNAVTELTEEITELYKENCRSLLKLFNGQKEEDYLTRAELNRNLGEWGESLELLELVTNDDLELYVKKIRKCVELGNMKVQPV